MHVAAVLLLLILVPLLSAAAAAAAFPGAGKNVTIMFFQPVTPEDMSYLRGAGGTITYNYSAINVVGLQMPDAAFHKLMTMYQNPSSPESHSIARNISYIAYDGMPYSSDVDAPASNVPAATAQPVPESGLQEITGPITRVSGIMPGIMFVFPIMPVAPGM